MSLLANESLAKHISKDPEGYGKHFGRVLYGDEFFLCFLLPA